MISLCMCSGGYNSHLTACYFASNRLPPRQWGWLKLSTKCEREGEGRESATWMAKIRLDLTCSTLVWTLFSHLLPQSLPFCEHFSIFYCRKRRDRERSFNAKNNGHRRKGCREDSREERSGDSLRKPLTLPRASHHSLSVSFCFRFRPLSSPRGDLRTSEFCVPSLVSRPVYLLIKQWPSKPPFERWLMTTGFWVSQVDSSPVFTFHY